jgi:hypothetical protein
MNKPRLWAALLAGLFATTLLCGGCKDFFHPEGPTKVPGPYPLTDEQAADAFRKTVKEALEITPAAIVLETPAEELAALETKVDEALELYAKLSQGARGTLTAEKAKLDAVKEKIGHVYSAQQFLGSHTEALAKQADDVITPEEAAALLPVLEAALEEYEALSDPVKELLKDHGTLLSSLKTKAEAILEAPKPVAVTITLQAAFEPSLEEAIVSKNDQITFTIESGPGIIAVDWYWNGELVEKAGGPSYILAAGSKPGIYELSAVVTGVSGESSARCRVTITEGKGGVE